MVSSFALTAHIPASPTEMHFIWSFGSNIMNSVSPMQKISLF